MLVIIIVSQQRQKKTAVIQRILKNKRIKGAKKMHELLVKYIGQECVVYTLSGSQLIGTVNSIKDGWLSLTNEGGKDEVLNLDYIIRIREVPRKKNGKKKSVVFD